MHCNDCTKKNNDVCNNCIIKNSSSSKKENV